MKKISKILVACAVAGMLAFSAAMLAGCGCSRDKGDDVKKDKDAQTVVGEWHLNYGVDKSNNVFEIGDAVKKTSYITIKEDMSAVMGMADGTYIGKIVENKDDLQYSDAFGHFKGTSYTFITSDGSIEINFGYVVPTDKKEKPFIMMPIGDDSYYYAK